MEGANWMEVNDCCEKTKGNSQQEARGCSHSCSLFDFPHQESLWSFTQDGQAVCVPEVPSDSHSPAILKELRAKPSERTKGGVIVSTSRCTSVFVQNNPGVKCAALTPALVFMCTDSITTASQCLLMLCPVSQSAAKPNCE